ncbi:N-methyl-L-tryptophan oxidase [Luteolibacter luteus]|uniref:N-methyl-L-tryptophan oxidase n=1 Tax=Luteolibacter luteus TaxID=2728835 RepID=A0A858RIW7_9BACT|nr:N-methyl-L-tryptophan oxidase [Luteolibacter luteus]QJE96521.1 N-methyl-L-tryptophan oxidase [Luteolibacter luteus]
MKVAVIGIGGSGSAALRFPAKAGHEAVGFEQFRPGHDRGSSHGHSRMIRKTYPDPFHTRMMAGAYELWDDLEREAEESLFVRCGGITFGPAGDPKLEATRRSLEEAGLPYERLSREESATRFPAIDIGLGSEAIYQAESGFLRATRCVLAQARLATAQGARLHEESPVLHLEEQGGAVLVSTASQTERFDAVIVTAGPWMGKLLAPLKLPLRTALRQVIYAGVTRNEELFQPDKLPVWIEEPSEYYGFPADGEMAGIKFASHDAGMDFDPDRKDRPVMAGHVERAMQHIATRFSDLSGEVIASQSCLYTITPDEHFILDRAPGSKRIIICSGCSGHGFKFTILLGKLAADMAASGRHDESTLPWSLSRFD